MERSERLGSTFNFQHLQDQAAQAHRQESRDTQTHQPVPIRPIQEPTQAVIVMDKENKPPRGYTQSRLPRSTHRAPLRDLTNQIWAQSPRPINHELTVAEHTAVDRETAEWLRIQEEIARQMRGEDMRRMIEQIQISQDRFEDMRGMGLQQLVIWDARRRNEVSRLHLGYVNERVLDMEREDATPLHQSL